MKYLLFTFLILAAQITSAQNDSLAICGGVHNEFELDEIPMIQLNDDEPFCNKLRVVVHVVYDGMSSTGFASGEITQEQVLSQIRITNQFFRNDSLGYDMFNVPLGYEIALATEDPEGNPTNGIVYHDGTALFGEAWHDFGLRNTNLNAVSVQTLANALSWGEDLNGKKYINSYVVPKIDGNSGSGVQAYAYFPTTSVVFGNYNLFNAFGAEQLETEYNQTFLLKTYTDLGYTWTHELLHNMAIFHTFQGNTCGPETNPLLQGDRVADTPPQTQGSECSGSCGFISYNVMDYLSQSCKNRITAGQADRANLAVMNSLYQYLVCPEEVPCGHVNQGDFNGDGIVNIIDVSLFGASFNCSNTSDCFDALFDMNCDGTINIVDFSILASHFGTDYNSPVIQAAEEIIGEKFFYGYYNILGQEIPEPKGFTIVKTAVGTEKIYR